MGAPRRPSPGGRGFDAVAQTRRVCSALSRSSPCICTHHGPCGGAKGEAVLMKRSSDDRTFRISTGIFAALVLLIVLGIGFELTRQSLLSIEKFGFSFWKGKTWDPVSGEFGALPFIWGTLYSSIVALIIATPVALGIAVFISELSPRFLRQPLTYLT